MSFAGLLDTALDRTLIGYGNVGYLVRRRTWTPGDPPAGALSGKVALVTGARSGLGRATVIGLARLGAAVRMVVRGREAGEAARAGILGEVPGAEVTVDECDLSSLVDVRAFAQRYRSQGQPLHVLLHNAGVLPQRREVTAEGNEVALATHVLGPHLLTRELAGALRGAAPSRVLWATSGGMYAQPLRLDDLQYQRGDYDGTTAYARTKRMQAVLARVWAQRLEGEGVVVHAAHPGWADTPGMARSLPTFKAISRPLLRTPAQGADTFVWLAAAAEPGRCTGRLWHDRATRPYHYLRRTRETPADREALWERVEELVG